MSLKDLFGKTSEKVVSETQLQELYNQAESNGYLEQLIIEKERFLPKIDFTSASNFARYGSAEKYYSDAIKNIYQRYPYDGSYKEKLEWRNVSSQFDLYVLDNVYPLTTGYVTLGSGSVASYVSGSTTYRSSSLPQYIRAKGGPNAGLNNKFENGNIYNLSKNLESNLGITSTGNTVEFWFKDSIADANIATDYSYCYFDLWNGIASGSSNYTRLTIERNSTNQFLVSYASGSSGVVKQQISYVIDKNNWHHYAFSFGNSESNNSDLEICLYVDGELIEKQTLSNKGNIELAYNYALQANIAAYMADEQGANSSVWNGLGLSFGSFDEFRFWKVKRTSQQISRFWFTNVGGGNNTDDANTNLGIYYKFNEGIINSSEINELDKTILDYSGRISNGTVVNYDLNVRNNNSAINLYFNSDTKEKKDPIIYSSNPLVQSTLEQYTTSGSLYDQENNSSIYKSLPSWITEEAEEKNIPDLSNLVQIISSYFDTLHVQIESLPRIKDVKYVENNEKPKPFINKILSSYAFENLDIFNDTTFLEEVLSRNETTEFNHKIDEIKNSIYQNIYNNIAFIYKSKGTEKAFRNLIRCFGIDDELIKINIYGNNSEYELTNKHTYTSINKKFVDFNDVDRYAGTVFQKNISGDVNTKGNLITNSKRNSFSDNYSFNIPLTLEAEIIFPKKVLYDSPSYVVPDFTEVSLFGIHTADESQDVLSWGLDEFNYQVYAIRRNEESKDVYFKLVGSIGNYPFDVTSSWYNGVYDNQKWNLAVRIYPEKLYNAYLSSGSSVNNYFIELVGNNYLVDETINNSFIISASIPENNAKSSINVRKRIYVGAHYQDFNGSVLQKSDVKISSVRFWYDYLNNEELKAHAIDASSYGRQHPNWQPHYIEHFGSGSVYFSTNDISASTNTITRADTLALYWSFETVTGSDSNGEFIVLDASSGSSQPTTDYGLNWFADLTKRQFTGLGYGFAANDSNVVNREYIYSAKLQNPEILTSNDLIQIPDTDDTIRSKTNRPVSYYLSFEKSMSQVINTEILNWFATIKDFNNLFGNPLNKYQKEYKDLIHIRKIFFEKVSNTPDFEKFLDFYKWIDSSISMMLTQLVPASSNYSDKVRNMVESHLLERNKYENKLPTIEFKKIDNIKIINAGNTSIDPFIDSLAPYNPTGSLWLKKRAIRTQEPVNTPSEPQNDIDREIIRQVIYSNNINSPASSYDLNTNQVYQSKNDVIRFFSKQYKLVADKLLNLEAIIQANGVENIELNTLIDINVDSIDPQSGSNFGKTLKNTIGNYQNTYEYLQLTSRTNNNKYIADVGANIAGTSSSSGLGFTDVTLPTRQTYKQIFVERFSAPGGAEINSRGALNKESEEYSAYNNLNYRNFRVRNNLNSWLAESSSTDADNPSYHKVNKNSYYVFASSSDTTGRKKYDNEFITRQIPRSDMQYTWLTASVLTKPSSSFYFTQYDNLKTYNSESLQFVSATLHPGETLITDFLGFNWFFIFTVNTSSNVISTVNPPHYIDLDLTAHQTNQYFLKLNGPYGYPSWKQINNRNNRLSIISRKNNNILVQDKSITRSKTVDNTTQNYTNRIEPTFTSYKEPPVMFNKPMVHKVNTTGSADTVVLSSPYDNNKYYFSNQSLMDRLELKLKDSPQLHDVLLNIDVNNLFTPKPEYIGAKYSLQVYPAKEYAGLKEIRTRNNYEETSGTGSNGYDRNVARIRSFWKDTLANRATTNAYSSSNGTGSINCLDIPSYSASLEPISSYVASPISNLPLMNDYTGSYRFSTYVFNDSLLQNFKLTFLSDGLDKLHNSRHTSSINNANAYDTFNSLDNTVTNVVDYFATANTASGPAYIDFISSSYRGQLAGMNSINLRNFLTQPSGTYSFQQVKDGAIVRGNKEVFKYNKDYNFIRPTPSLNYNVKNPHSRIFTYISSSNSVLFNGYTPVYFEIKSTDYGSTYYTDLIAGLSGKKPFYNSYEDYIKQEKPLLKNYSIIPEYKISDFMDYFIKEKQGNFRIGITGSYLSVIGSDLQFNDIKSVNSYNKTTALNNFILEDFNTNKLSNNNAVSGSKLTINIDAIIKLLPYKGFYPSERITQVIDLFQKSFFNLTDSDYNGFYVTSNGITSSVVDQTIKNYLNTSNGSPLVQQVQTLLQPMFAPGVFFNTVKSGIAVDWPVYLGTQEKYTPYKSYNNADNILNIPKFYNTASLVNKAGAHIYLEASGTVYMLDTEPDYRFQFEDLLDLSKLESATQDNILYYLDPTRINQDSFSGSDRNNIRFPSYNIKNPYRDINKNTSFFDQRYLLAMNNYLGEIPKFFLEGGNLTSFYSNPQSEWPEFVAGKEYRMDIVLSKDENLQLMLSSSTIPGIRQTLDNAFVFPDELPQIEYPIASRFGPPVRYFDFCSGSYLQSLNIFYNPTQVEALNNYPIIYWSNTDYYAGLWFYQDPAYAPYVPPYFYGTSRMSVVFKPTETRAYKVSEVQDSLILEQTNDKLNNLFISSSIKAGSIITGSYRMGEISFIKSNYENSPAYKAAMPITSSVNLKIITREKDVTYDADSNPNTVNDNRDYNTEKWVIQTKYETPVLNFNNFINYLYSYSEIVDSDGALYGYRNGGYVLDLSRTIANYHTGMWSGYGFVDPVNNIKLAIQDPSIINSSTASLASHIGFTGTAASNNKKIGQVAQKKQIKEAIVLIPYIDKTSDTELPYAKTVEIINENGKSLISNPPSGVKYFGVDKGIISELLGTQIDFNNSTIDALDKRLKILKDGRTATDSITSTTNTQSTTTTTTIKPPSIESSIIKTINLMREYNIPPHLDWVTYRGSEGIDPFVMYIVEFEQDLDQEDLADIWQGIMPKNSLNGLNQVKNISHNLGRYEFFHGLTLPNNIKWKIFKVKKKANDSYYKLTLDSRDDNNFKFKFGNINKEPEYSYNWPYDFFSMIELVNVSVDLETEEKSIGN